MPMDWTRAELLASFADHPSPIPEHKEEICAALGIETVGSLSQYISNLFEPCRADPDRHSLLIAILKVVDLYEVEIDNKFFSRLIKVAISEEQSELLKRLLIIKLIQRRCNSAKFNPFGVMLAQKKIDLFYNLLDQMSAYELGVDHSPIRQALVCGSISALQEVLKIYSPSGTDQPSVGTLINKAIKTKSYAVFTQLKFVLGDGSLAPAIKHDLFMDSLLARNLSISIAFAKDLSILEQEKIHEFRAFDLLVADTKRKNYRDYAQSMIYILAARYWPTAVFSKSINISYRFQKSTYKAISQSIRAVNATIVGYVGGLREQVVAKFKSSKYKTTSPIPGDCWGKVLIFSGHISIDEDLQKNETMLNACSSLPNDCAVELLPLIFSETSDGYYMRRAVCIWSALAKKYDATEDATRLRISPRQRP